jgi:hypothetical protein
MYYLCIWLEVLRITTKDPSGQLVAVFSGSAWLQLSVKCWHYLGAVPLGLGNAATDAVIAHSGRVVPCRAVSPTIYRKKPTSAEAENTWKRNSASPIRRYGMELCQRK